MKTLLLLFFVIFSPIVQSQTITVDLVPPVAEKEVTAREILRAKREQQALAERQDVRIERVDRGQRSSSRIVGVPFEFREKVITGKADLEALLPRLYPYYGFTGAESLRFDGEGQGQRAFSFDLRYTLRQYIDDIPSSEVLGVWVNPESRTIERFQGALMVDTGLRRRPYINWQSAVQRTLECIEGMEQWRMPMERYAPNGDHAATLYYRPSGLSGALAPWWSVGIQLREQQPPPFGHESFWLAPDGMVVPQIYTSHFEYERCERSKP